jgi:hypothetical protein
VDLFCVLKRDCAVPAIVIFTKYDMFVTSAIGAGGDDVAGLDGKQIWRYGEVKAREAVESQCFRPWRETLGEVPLVMVSGTQSYLLILLNTSNLLVAKPRFKNSIQKLIEATDKEMPRQGGVASYTEPVPLNWASAQRGDPDIKIKASVEWVFTLNEACLHMLMLC